MFTANQIKEQFQNQLGAAKDAASSIGAAATDAAKALAQIPANFLQCSAKTIISYIPFLGSSSSSSANCLSQASDQLKNVTDKVSAAVQSSLKQAQSQSQPKDSKSDDNLLKSAADQYKKINEETSACVQDAVASSEPASDPSDPASDPSDPASDPSEPASDPSDPASEPSDEAESA